MELKIGDFIKVKSVVGILPFLQGRLGQIVEEILEKDSYRTSYFKIMVEGKQFTLSHLYMDKYERRKKERREDHAYCPACYVSMKKLSALDEDGDPVWYCWKCGTERFIPKEEE
jgi:Zn ribbon nucleic-acid-binding protein